MVVFLILVNDYYRLLQRLGIISVNHIAIRSLPAGGYQFVRVVFSDVPNIHLLYPKNIEKELGDFIENEMVPLCENEVWIRDYVGDGPQKL